MKTHAANDKLTSLIQLVEDKGVEVKSIIKSLKDLRESALVEQDPLVTKVLRLSYEYLEENKSFDVEAQYEEDEEDRNIKTFERIAAKKSRFLKFPFELEKR